MFEKRRAAQLTKAAQKNDLLGAGEAVQVCIPVGANVHLASLHKEKAQRYAIAATDDRVYVFSLGQNGFRTPRKMLFQVPVRDAVVAKEKGTVKIAVASDSDVEFHFQTFPIGPPDELIEFVAARRLQAPGPAA